MTSSGAVAGFKVSVDVQNAESVEQGLAALGAARETILRESKMLYVQCRGGECPESIHALLAEWGYQDIARIPASSTLCFARAGVVAMAEGTRASVLVAGATVRQKLDALQARASALLLKNNTYRTVRNMALDIRGRRPDTLRGRKLHKLLVTPEKFLEDSSHPLLSGPGLRAFQTVVPPDDSREVTIFDFPKRTMLVCIGADSEVDLDGLASCTEGLTLQTEIVVILSSAHAASTSKILAAIRCPRARLYVMVESGVDEILRYGLSRTYATNVMMLASPIRCPGGSVDASFAQLSREDDYFCDSSLGIVGARREVWRDLLSGKRHDADLTAGVAALLESLGAMASDSPGTVPKTERVSDYSRYPGVAPYRPFADHKGEAPVVTCFDRKAQWPHAASPNWSKHEALISVIMTVYNAADTVAGAIESVLAQTYRNLELLIIDDCSSDDSLSVLREKAQGDDRIRVLQTARNSGTYVAKNVGLRFARGAFATFHDADDISALNRLEFQSYALSSDPDAIGNYTRYQRLSEDGHEVWLNGRTNRPGYITLMFRREAALKAAGYFDSVRVSADAEYVERLQIATGRTVRLLPTVLYYALQAEGSLTTAGVAAFGVDAEGRSTMPPVRQMYREAARRWHEDIYEGRSESVMPFPLSSRPFFAPLEIRPERRG